jgi:hypothetical protein
VVSGSVTLWAGGNLAQGALVAVFNTRKEVAGDPQKARQAVRAYLLHYQLTGKYPSTPQSWARIHH